MRTDTITVHEIHCEGCERAVANALGRLDGVAEVAADHRTDTVTVTYDGSIIDLTTIRERLADAGYEPADG